MQRRVAFLPSVGITLKALKRKATDFAPKTIGDHVRKRRLELGLTQKATAQLLQVNQFSVINWEKHGMTPLTTTMGRVISFLGYDPLPRADSLADRIRAKRRQMGWSQRQLAGKLGVDRCTVANWEAGRIVLRRVHQAAIATLLKLPLAAVNSEMTERWNGTHGR